MSRLFLSLLAAFVMTLLSVSCAPPAPTLPPTLTFSPAPSSTPAPTLTPAPTETPTPTPRPTREKITLTGTFGLPEEIAQKFAGAEKYITRAPDGSYQVTALGRDPQTGAIDVVDLTLLPETFSSNKDLKNPLAPATVRAKTPENLSLKPTPTIDTLESHPQKGPSEYTLIWTGKEFRVVPNLPIIVKNPNTKNPSFDYEAFNQIPRYTLEDIQSGFAVQSLLSHILERMDKGESLADILYINPEDTRYSWEKFGGNSLFFKMESDGKFSLLKAKGNDRAYEKTLEYDNMTMKILPLAANIEIDGQTHLLFYIANFDPLDPANPDPNDLSNWKFLLSIPNNLFSPENAVKEKSPSVPYILLYGDEKYQQNHPLLAQLLSIEGNDPNNLPFYAYGHQYHFFDLFAEGFSGVENSSLHVYERPYADDDPNGGDRFLPLPPQLQQMILLFEVGVAQ